MNIFIIAYRPGKMTDLTDKLIRVERTINIHNIDNELIQEVEIDIPLSKLIEIVTPNEDDPELYDGYQLDVNQLNEINQRIKNTIQINPNESYYLVSAGIYNW